MSADPATAKAFIGEWKKRRLCKFAGSTESFRGYDGIRTIAAAIEKAGKAEPEAIRAALWEVELTGLNGKIKFKKAGRQARKAARACRTSTSSRSTTPRSSSSSSRNSRTALGCVSHVTHGPGVAPSVTEPCAVRDRARPVERLRANQVDQFLQHLVNALILGGTYALLGIGLTLIFGIMRVVNFTHGELYAFGAYMVYYCRRRTLGIELLRRAAHVAIVAGHRCSAP